MKLNTIVEADRDFMQAHAEELELIKDEKDLATFFESFYNSNLTYWAQNSTKMERIVITLTYDLLGAKAFTVESYVDNGTANTGIYINKYRAKDLKDLELLRVGAGTTDVIGRKKFWMAYKFGEVKALEGLPEDVARAIVFDSDLNIIQG